MPSPSFEFKPFPRGLYTADQLFDGFDPDRPVSYAEMRDTLIYREFVAGGGAACGDYLTTMSRALHDNGITQALAQAIDGEKVVAIMGGHAGSRRDSIYAETARLAAKLAKAGFTVASGGGPGIMEAAHLGAAFAGDAGLEDALKELATDPVPAALPTNAGKLIKADGTIDLAIAQALGDYVGPAVRIARALGHGGGLGVPTWLYGHEPTTPFAQPIAKYFQNSIREDGLLALATNGIIYMRGGAGTLQEVFQDTAQNYYKTFPTGPGKTGEFSPMVFYGDFWTKTIRVRPVLKALFGKPAKKPDRNIGNEFKDWVRFLVDPDAVIAHLASFEAKPSAALEMFRASAKLQLDATFDALLPSTVLVRTDEWNQPSQFIVSYPDGSCVGDPQGNRDRTHLQKLSDLGSMQTCDQTGSWDMTRCAII